MAGAKDSFRTWINKRLAVRPAWMNLMLFVCLYLTFIYMPYDFFVKPVASDVEVWFGNRFYGWSAKATEPIHWAIYALGAYGFWRMRSWMWPWAGVYAALLTFSMAVWPIVYIRGASGWAMALGGLVIFGAFTWALFASRDLFQKPAKDLRARYGDWAVVTGASAGIGLEFARAFAEQGINCVLVARRRERLSDLKDMLTAEFGVQIEIVDADLSTDTGLDKVIEACSNLPIGILVNNAGFGLAGRFEKQHLPRLREMIALNCTAPVVLTHALLPGMTERKRGAVIITGSVAGRQPVALHTVYAATKSFNLFFGEALYAELLSQGIDCLVLQPGPVATEFEAVAREARVNPRSDEQPEDTVATALEHLGQSPSVVSGWFNWVRANANRVLPRSLLVFVGAIAMEQQTPSSMR